MASLLNEGMGTLAGEVTILTGHLQGCAWDERGDDSKANVMRKPGICLGVTTALIWLKCQRLPRASPLTFILNICGNDKLLG